eukprot:scaffold34729_cov199-Amphora_coffeaeformis.AAC.2
MHRYKPPNLGYFPLLLLVWNNPLDCHSCRSFCHPTNATGHRVPPHPTATFPVWGRTKWLRSCAAGLTAWIFRPLR